MGVTLKIFKICLPKAKKPIILGLNRKCVGESKKSLLFLKSDVLVTYILPEKYRYWPLNAEKPHNIRFDRKCVSEKNKEKLNMFQMNNFHGEKCLLFILLLNSLCFEIKMAFLYKIHLSRRSGCKVEKFKI